MLYSTFRMTGCFALTTFAAVLMVAAATPAFAINGRNAVGACIDSTAGGARCAWSVNGKGEIDICNKSGCVYCASADAQCKPAARGRPRPTRTLPVGAIVKTPVLNVQVSKQKPFTGRILQFRCMEGFRMCPGHGCISNHDHCDPVQ
jgi:hypothetical protein